MEQNLWIGSYAETGTHQVQFTNGKISEQKDDNTFENCSYLCKNNHILYSIIEYSNNPIYQNGYIIARNEDFSVINSSPIFGQGPCYLTIDTKRNLLYVANYGDGSLDCFSLRNDGSIEKSILHKTYTDHSRIHYLSLSMDNDFLFVVDLGDDTIFAYKILYSFENLELKEMDTFSFSKGSAPRHITIRENIIYLITENSCELYQLSFTAQNGFKIISKASLLPSTLKKDKDTTGCAIKISKDLKFIYTSIRGHNCISVFQTIPHLKLIQNISCFGITPRDIYIDDSQNFLLCANQHSEDISIFRRDKKTGYLNFLNKYPIDSPACII